MIAKVKVDSMAWIASGPSWKGGNDDIISVLRVRVRVRA